MIVPQEVLMFSDVASKVADSEELVMVVTYKGAEEAQKK